MKTIRISLIACFCWIGLSACEQHSEQVAETASLRLQIASVLNGQAPVYNTKRYTNAAGNEFTIEQFAFYLSHLQLIDSQSGQVYSVPESFHLIAPSTDNHIVEIALDNIPAGTYDQLKYAIGVDPIRNLSLDQLGDLDPSNNMAWDWNTGYKFVLLEGRFFPESGETRGLVYHIGTDKNYRERSHSFAGGLALQPGSEQNLRMHVEISSLFGPPSIIDFNEHNVVMFQDISTEVMDNFEAQGISFSVAN